MQITFQWVGGATVLLQFDHLKIAVDPVLCPKGTVQDYFWFKSRRIDEPVYKEADFRDVDLWLITHNHEDHLDAEGLAVIDPLVKVISNGNTAGRLRKHGCRELTVLDWGQSSNLDLAGYGIEVETIPAIHGVNPLSALLAGKGNGYFLKVSKGEEQVGIYLTGDMVFKAKTMRALHGKQIYLLIANMGAAKAGSWIMTLTLNAKMLKRMISELEPKQVIPVHYGTFAHYREPVSRIREIGDERIQIVNVGSSTTLYIPGEVS